LEWLGKTWREDGLAEEAFKRPADHPAKQALVALLRERYRTIEAFNAALGVSVKDFDALAAATEPPRSQSEAALSDKREFARLVAERYFGEAARAIRKHDPNHLILGCRFAGSAPDVWDIAGKFCDVVSVNTYRQIDLDTGEVLGFEKDLHDWYGKAQRPLMITEWSFPALDAGLPSKHGAGQRFDTQAQRAKAFEIFQTLLLRTPFMVGSDYFMWADEPALGISAAFPEDSNYGLVNEHDVPYPELTETATRVHARWRALHEESPRASAPKEAKPPAYKPGAPWAADVNERLPFLVWSAAPTEQPVLVAVKLRDLWPAADAGDLVDRALSVVDDAGASVPFEADRLPDGPEIAFRLKPNPARAMFLYLAPRPIAHELAAPMLTVNGGSLRIHNGPLVLDKEQPSAAIFDRVEFDGTKVGSFSALLWQADNAGNHWDRDSAAEMVAAAQGLRRVVADFVTTGAGDDLGYRAAYRVTAWKGEPWFSSRCLWIENTTSKPWTLTAYYPYAQSAFGADGIVGGPDVPNYYLPFAVWTDPKLDVSYGALSPRLGELDTNFWKDERGGEHADFSRRVEVTLQPAQRFDAPQPEGIIFAARGPVREAAVAIGRQVRAAQAVRFKGLPAERR
jgi:hypothetical protein